MSDPVHREDFSGQVRIRCDYETYLAFRSFAEQYYSYEDALKDLLRVADDNPRLVRYGGIADDIEWGKPGRPPSWG